MVSFLKAIRSAQIGQEIPDRGERESVRGLYCRRESETLWVFVFRYRPKNQVPEVKTGPSGKSYLHYKQRRLKIGEFGPMTVGQARTQAAEWAARVELGQDPKGDRDDARSEPTVGQIYQQCLDELWKKESEESGWAKNVEIYWASYLKKPFAELKLGEVTAARVIKWHAEARKTSLYSANRSLAVLRKAFNHAIENGRATVNPCARIGKAAKSAEVKRKRYATPEEIQRLGAILRREAVDRPVHVAFLFTLAFSGARPRSIERATWKQLKVAELDGKRFGVLEFKGKTSKVTGEHERVVIPPPALELIESIPRTDDPRIFGIPIPRKFWKRVCTEAQCPDLWARDWRRTFASVGRSRAGVGMDRIAPLLNHQTTQTTALYAKLFDDEPARDAMTIAAAMADLLDAPAPK